MNITFTEINLNALIALLIVQLCGVAVSIWNNRKSAAIRREQKEVKHTLSCLGCSKLSQPADGGREMKP